jgi:hypothetical protein
MTTADGNGALVFAPPNFNLPRKNRISPNLQLSHHQAVSTRAGTKQTTIAPASAANRAFSTHNPIDSPYGGFIQQAPIHS